MTAVVLVMFVRQGIINVKMVNIIHVRAMHGTVGKRVMLRPMERRHAVKPADADIPAIAMLVIRDLAE